jgi:hypothetical protein
MPVHGAGREGVSRTAGRGYSLTRPCAATVPETTLSCSAQLMMTPVRVLWPCGPALHEHLNGDCTVPLAAQHVRVTIRVGWQSGSQPADRVAR